jgi:hypothetical protein
VKRERVEELAKECMADIVGPNDEIADDPARWGQPLKSWSLDELRGRLEQAIRQALAEQIEDDCMTIAQQLKPGISAQEALRNAVRAIRAQGERGE